jgi:Na+-driven multidrug efflux pump
MLFLVLQDRWAFNCCPHVSNGAVAAQGWWSYLQYGGPACAMMCLEWWFFEIAAMLSGLLPDAQVSLAVTGIVVQFASLAFMVPLGVSIALGIRVSNLLGVPTISTRALTMVAMQDIVTMDTQLLYLGSARPMLCVWAIQNM